MKHITYGVKTLFVDDEAADTLMQYSAILANEHRADTVDLNAISGDGNEIVATFLLDAGASIVAESTNSVMEPPDNSEAIRYMRERMRIITDPPESQGYSQAEMESSKLTPFDENL